ncbi:hypothetical protein KNO15_07290 [Leifsonia shinshuensis]|uniref:hypothetical protein n=1 Tax=Leifsonia shinshuensis TaxID=150026 RepID=UPI001F508463|nr:hypothetical protein [Leifsonia shinshuensis]MCI0156498.1 hypothetical protein [Leifsonia shinshuensis]
MTKITDDELEARVRAVAGVSPAQNAGVAASLTHVLDQLSDPDIRSGLTPKPVWWRRRPVLGAALGVIIAVGVVGVPAAAAVQWLAHTGMFGGQGTEVDKSEWIGLDASDAPSAIRGLYPAWMPLPAGTTRADAEATVGSLYHRSVDEAQEETPGHVLTQETDIRRMFESYGRCTWYRAWIDADQTRDEAALALATKTIDEATGWPATVSTDGSGVVDHLREVARSAGDGDRDAIVAAYGIDGCAPFTGNLGG